VRRIVGSHEGRADALQQYEAHAPRLHFLVDLHMLQCRPRRDLWRGERQTDPVQQGPQSRDIRIPQVAAFAGHRRGHQHSGAHGLPVQPGAVAAGRFNRMAEGVAQVQQGAIAVFALILTDDFGLDLAGAADGMGQRFGVPASSRSILTRASQRRPRHGSGRT